MSSMSRGKPKKAFKVVKPKKNTKHTTKTTRNFRFQTFNERITNLKIDPIRRRRHVEAEEKAGEESHTYFGSALEEWRDTNLSQTFSAFAKEAAPYCDNLAVVLYNEDKIMELLETYISKGDELAMEPLLNLLSHFAHDLDARFEKHFQRAVATVTTVAAKHSDFAVIEWSFNCLAWLFKYLSRLLTPDLRSLYKLLAPYLGKEQQRPFIVRFTAEAISFLVRKASVTYEKDHTPLDLIVHCMLEDCEATEGSTADLYEQGIMTVLTEAVKGVQGSVNSNAPAILSSILKHAGNIADAGSVRIQKITSGILTSLIHHCDSDAFQPVMNVLYAYTDDSSVMSTSNRITFCSNLLFTVTSVRKGTRVKEWKRFVGVGQALFSACETLPDLDENTATSVLSLLAVTLQSCTIDVVLATRRTLESLRSGRWVDHFLPFCDMFVRLGNDRFNDFVLPYLQKYILDQTASSDRLWSLLPKIAQGKPGLKLKCEVFLPDNILAQLENLLDPKASEHELLDRIAGANEELTLLANLSISKAQSQRLQELLLRLVNAALEPGITTSQELDVFALGAGLRYLLSTADVSGKTAQLMPGLCRISGEFVGLPVFWSNLLHILKTATPADLDGEHVEVLEKALVVCLTMPSHGIRQDGLDILQRLYRICGRDEPSALSTAITIESLPVNLESSRSISMNIRRLVPGYHELAGDDILVKAVPAYCFGLLHVNLSQAWDDAINTLAAISSSKHGEDAVIDLAQTWITGKTDPEVDTPEHTVLLDGNANGFKIFSDFECPNLAKLAAIRQQVFKDPLGGHPSSQQRLAAEQKRSSPITITARTQALKVLNKIPSIAEKRSRLLVPVLLDWTDVSTKDGGEREAATQRWARKDQKAMLNVFAQFVNPKVLYKSEEVHQALLSLCANGDVEIQQAALKAILAWKDPSVVRYQEHLRNLLDEARFREELSVFLRDDNDDEEDGIKEEDYAALMPVLLRLLYGRSVAGGKEGQGSRRKAIFVALSRFGGNVLGQFLDIALTSVMSEADDLEQAVVTSPKAPSRQQFGMLNMIADMLQVLGAELEPHADKSMRAVLTCTIDASRKLDQAEVEADVSLLRSIRQAGMQCLVKAFSHLDMSNSQVLGNVIIENLIKPRLDTFARENTQSVAATLRLFGAWASKAQYAAFFTETGSHILASVANLLKDEHAKDEVRLFILQDVMDNLVKGEVDQKILQPHISVLVSAVGSVIEQHPSKEVLDACVSCFSQLAGRITSDAEAAKVTRICTDLLVKPTKLVSPWTKTGLLRTLLPLVEQFDLAQSEGLYEALCAMFSRYQDSASRILLSQVLYALVEADPELSEAAKNCEGMNAMGTRLDEPDHDRRERAFAWLYEKAKSLSLKQWLPVVHNCLHFIKDDEDRVNRFSASRGLQLYVDAAALHRETKQWIDLLDDAVFSGIECGMRESSELVRAEYLVVLETIVKQFQSWQKVSGLQPLLVSGEEEASFFTNVLHVQQHRRLRALRRLGDNVSNLGTNNVSRIFLPLLEHFVFDQLEGDSGRTLADQAVQTIGSLAQVLNRAAFRATFQRYTGFLKTKPDLEKIVLRLLGALVDGVREAKNTELNSQAIIGDHLPPLLEYLHQRDESTVDRRMPVAVTIVKLMLMLPMNEFTARLPAVLTDVSHVLRSRSQEARDETRKALKAIALLVGPQYFRFILQALRGALKRGYQLHVLSFTVHSLLVESNFAPGDIDECLPDIMLVIMDDIFGITGQEKDAEEYKSGMKEVKSSKSFDTMEHLARVTPINKLGELVRPIRSMLSEKVDMKSVKKIDDLLSRLRKGLDQNPASDTRDMLSFCWEIVSRTYVEESAPPTQEKKVDERRKRYLVQPEAQKSSKVRGATTLYRFKLISFGLDLLRKVVRRHEDLQTPQNMAGFLSMAGDALVQGQEEVKVSAMRLLSTIMRVPLAQIESNAPVYLKEAVAMIKGAISIDNDAARAALELVTSVLREKRTVTVKEKDVATILKRIASDIDEPDTHGTIYKFLRAILGRKIVITEVYEVMDEVGKAMVTNPDRHIRESARSAYLQFVMEYPQGKDRWKKQTSFLVGNLKYEHAAGRQSVMEFLHQMLDKIGDDVLADIGSRVFVSLLPVIVSDSDSSCRQMAGLLIGKIFERASDDQLAQFLSLMDTWLQKVKKSTVKAGALQSWAILVRTRELSQNQLEGLREKLEDIISDFDDEETFEPQLALDALRTFAALAETSPAIAFSKASSNLWQAIQQLPNTDSTEVKESVASLLGTFFTDVASASSKSSEGLAGLPLRGSGGLEIGADDMRRLCAVNLRALRAISLSTSETLIPQIVRNIVFLGRCFAANEMPWRETNQDASDDDEAANEEEDADASEQETKTDTALSNLLHRLASMLTADKFSITSRTATLLTITSILPHVPEIPSIQTLLRPLYALTDPSVPKPPGDRFKNLESKAQELLEAIQKRIGSETFVKELAKTRENAKGRRDERRRKRRIEAVSMPEKWAREKKRKYEGKKEKKREKSGEFRGMRRGW